MAHLDTHLDSILLRHLTNMNDQRLEYVLGRTTTLKTPATNGILSAKTVEVLILEDRLREYAIGQLRRNKTPSLNHLFSRAARDTHLASVLADFPTHLVRKIATRIFRKTQQ